MICTIIGASGVGKTTLIREIEKQFPHYVSITNVMRSFSKSHNLKLNESASCDAQLLFFNNFLQLLLTNTEKNVILDRSLLDSYTYSQHINSPIDPFIMDYMFNICKKYMTKFDKIFYIPIEFNIEHDGVRSDDQGYHYRIDKSIQNNLQMLELGDRVVRVTGTVQQRLDIVKEHLF